MCSGSLSQGMGSISCSRRRYDRALTKQLCNTPERCFFLAPVFGLEHQPCLKWKYSKAQSWSAEIVRKKSKKVSLFKVLPKEGSRSSFQLYMAFLQKS